jgi:bifunctional non-homologous end joining protein LigD
MLATAGGRPFTDPAWIYEIKYDGYRCMARIEGGQVQLRTRNCADCTKWYPEVAQVLARLPGGPHLVDGEACVLDDIGRSDYERLHARSRRRRWVEGAPVTFCAFDLLMFDGENLMQQPLTARKARLARLFEPLRGRAIVVGDFPAQAELFDRFVLGARLEGFVAKRKASTYQPGIVSPDWRKIKRPGAVPAQRFTR